MHRFFLSDLTAPALTGSESHHARQVLRLRKGDEVTVFDGAGNFARCQVAGITREAVALRPVERGQTPPLPCRITLACAIIKKNMDFIVQKATELGAAAIVPLITERTIARPEKSDRWREIALEACKQCGNNWLPEIAAPLPVKEFLLRTVQSTDAGVATALSRRAAPNAPTERGGYNEQRQSVVRAAVGGTDAFDLKVVAALEPGAKPLRQVLTPAKSVCVLIGPEGDFTPAEYAAARTAGYWPVTLGPLVLRADTAALYALSIVHHELVTHRGVC